MKPANIPEFSIDIQGKTYELCEPVSNLILGISKERDYYFELLVTAHQTASLLRPTYQGHEEIRKVIKRKSNN